MPTVVIDACRIHDWESFHDVFAEALHFPGYYGRNLDAWIDCMTDICGPEEITVVELAHARDFAHRCPEIHAALIDSAAFVNWRLIHNGHGPAIALAWND